MKNQLIKNMLILSLFTLVSSYAMSQSVVKVKAAMSNLPKTMEAGSTSKVALNITNTGTNEWSSEHLHGKEYSIFDVTKEWSGVVILQPGETTQLYYKITAPNIAGKYKLVFTVYNDGKKVASRTRTITVTDAVTPDMK